MDRLHRLAGAGNYLSRASGYCCGLAPVLVFLVLAGIMLLFASPASAQVTDTRSQAQQKCESSAATLQANYPMAGSVVCTDVPSIPAWECTYSGGSIGTGFCSGLGNGQRYWQYVISCDLGHTGPPPTAGNITANASEALFQCLAFNSQQFVNRHDASSSTVYEFKECRDQGSPATFYQAIFNVTTHTVSNGVCQPGLTTVHERAQYSWEPDSTCANQSMTLPPTWEQELFCNAGCEFQVVGSCGHGSVGCMLAATSTGASCGSNYQPPPPPTPPDPGEDPPPPGGDPGDEGSGATNEHLGPKLDAIAEAVRRHQEADKKGHADTQATIAATTAEQTTKLRQGIDGTTAAVNALGTKIDGVAGMVGSGSQAIVDAIEGLEVGGSGEGSGGGTCSSPVVCDNTVIECIMAVNLHRLRCGSETDLGDNAGAIGMIDDAIEHFTGFNPGDWEIPNDGDDGEMEGIDAIRYTQEINDDTFDDSGFMGGGGSCPSFTSIPVKAGVIGIDMQAICDLLTWVSYFVLALAWFQAVRIIAS